MPIRKIRLPRSKTARPKTSDGLNPRSAEEILPELAPVDPVAEEKHEQEVEEGLSVIYRDEEGKMPDLTAFEPVRSRWWMVVLGGFFGFIALLLVAAWMGFSLLNPFRGFSGQGLSLRIEGPEQIALGQEVTYFVNYENISGEPLAQADVRISFPSDFVARSQEPGPTGEGGAWKIGSIPVEGRGVITIRGTFTGALGTATAIQVVGSYRPASFNSDFEALATKALSYSESVIQGSLHVPVKVLPGDTVTIAYTIHNAGQEEMPNMVARLTLPDGFQRDASSTDGLIEGRTIRIPVGTLAAGASTTVMLTGTFASGSSGEAHVIAEVGRPQTDGVFLASQRAETSFTVLAGDLSLKLVMNGRDTDQTIPFGSVLNFTVAYENTASEDLKDVRIQLHLDPMVSSSTKNVSPMADWKTYSDNASGTQKGDAVIWTKQQIAALGRLPPHEDGSIDASIHALRTASGTMDIPIRAYIEAEVGSVGETKVNRIVRSAPMMIRYQTDASLLAEARYFSEEGAPIGSGPLPPVVDQTTTYRVHWSATKTLHELKDMRVTATLPKSIAWTEVASASAGTITYDAEARRVTWILNRLPANVNEVTADFDLRLTPTQNDANRFASLLGQTQLEAVDVSVDQPVKRMSPALTTDLQNDESAQGKGVVRKP